MGNFGVYSFKAPKKGLCDPKKFYDENGNVRCTDDGVNDLYVMAEITLNTHFGYIKDPCLKEDMMSSAVTKMWEFIQSGTFDPSRGSLRNLLYTCSRNQQKNEVYRYNRDFPAEDEVMASNPAGDIVVSTDAIKIDDKIFDRLLRCTEEEVEKVKSSLNNMGFETSSNDYHWYPEVTPWVSMVIWWKHTKGGI